MITIRKLTSLPRKTMLRKAAALLQGFEIELRAEGSIDFVYLRQLLQLVDSGDETALNDLLQGFRQEIDGGPTAVLKLCNTARHRLLAYLGDEPADWDLLPTGSGARNQSRHIMPFRVYLEDMRSPFNVGSIFRSAESFGIEEIVLSPDCPSPDHPRARRSAMGCTDIIPWKTAPLSEVAGGGPLFVLELGGTPIDEFTFPGTGTVVIGSEELGASPEARAMADRSAGRVSIPLYGLKGSLNVSAAFAILAHAWCSHFL